MDTHAFRIIVSEITSHLIKNQRKKLVFHRNMKIIDFFKSKVQLFYLLYSYFQVITFEYHILFFLGYTPLSNSIQIQFSYQIFERISEKLKKLNTL